MNVLDLLIILLVVASIFRGRDIGIIRQASSLIGLIGGLLFGSYLADTLNASLTATLLIIILSIILVMGISEYAAVRLKIILHERSLNKVDKVLGAGMGIVTALALVWFGSVLVTALPSSSIKQQVRDSKIIAWLDQRLPPATATLSTLQEKLAQTRIPDILGQLEPALPNRSASLPDLGEYNAAVEMARASVVEIDGRSCRGIGVGSGFVIANDMVVTNAHVVAGMLHPYVEDDNGRHDADVIAFDEDLDIAVLSVKGLAGRPLNMISGTVDVGTGGVVMGYPNGGGLRAVPAVVIQHFAAIGRDIYEEGRTNRDVYALRADVQPGNSGGPLLDRNGNVYGVIFARSTSYDQVGYAVSTPAVQEVVQQAMSSPSAGKSRRCLAS